MEGITVIFRVQSGIPEIFLMIIFVETKRVECIAGRALYCATYLIKFKQTLKQYIYGKNKRVKYYYSTIGHFDI